MQDIQGEVEFELHGNSLQSGNLTSCPFFLNFISFPELGLKPKASQVLGKHSSTELLSQT